MVAIDDSASMLCARGDSRHQFHRKKIDSGRRELPDRLWIAERVGEANDRLAAAQQRWIGGRRADLQNDVRRSKQFGSRDDHRALRAVGLVRKAGSSASSRFHRHFESRLHERREWPPE